jgi:hypothetical protein
MSPVNKSNQPPARNPLGSIHDTGDSAVNSILESNQTNYAEVEKRRGLTPGERKKIKKDKERTRGIYDLTPELKNLVQVLSTAVGTSNSQTVEYLCRFALNRMEEFNPDTTPTRSMNFDRDLVMLDIPKHFLREEEKSKKQKIIGTVSGTD